MTFTETLKFIEENKLDLNKLILAKAVKDILVDNDSTCCITRFEDVCEYLYDCWKQNKFKLKAKQLCIAFRKYLEDDYTEQEIIGIREYNFNDKASYINE